MRKFVWVGLFLLLSARVNAQTHYCDTTPSTSGSAVTGSVHTIQFCSDNKDATGTVTLIPTSFTIYVDGTAAPITMTRGTTSSVSGKTVYTGSYTVTNGQHSLQVTATANSLESAKSSPFVLTGVNAVPSAPSLLSIQ